MPLPPEDRKYNYSDYLNYPENERWELIEGVPYMQAAPSWQHQAITFELARQFGNYLIDKSYRAFTSPFDLIIPQDGIKEDKSQSVFI